MIVKTIDLYEYYGLEKPENAVGKLTQYLPDIFEAVSFTRKRPAMLVLPGGGYEYTSPREGEPIALKYLTKGYCAFVLNYSTKPCKYPTALREAGMAMAYIRENAEEFHVNDVCAIGGSAGGHLCACLATIYADKSLDFLGDKKSFVKPDACVLLYPVITSGEKTHGGSFENLCGDDKALREYLSLENRVNKDSVPAYIFATLGDTCVPCKNSLLLACAYEKAGVPFSLHILEKGYHGLSVNDITSDSNARLLEREPSTPENYNDWVEQSLVWLKERGIKIED
ncbi:MAG: alpha/beta hydrolase [Clostridiales bacterium]|nr:alpha/beta hydrolase [Clostridiales bacterium]